MLRLLAGVALLPLGLVVGIATGAAHPTWWGLPLGWAATLAALWACPPGWPRTGYAAGWMLVLTLLVAARPEGDFVISGDPAGYAYLGLGLVVLVGALATLPRPRGREPVEEAGEAPQGAK